MVAKRACYWLAYFLVRVLICVIQAMRIETCERLARLAATVFHRVLKIRRGVIDDNLRHSFPAMPAAARDRLAWKMWHHLFLMVMEIAHAPRKIHRTNWRRYLKVKNVGPLVGALLDDRPAVLVSAHFGNFEIAGYMLGIYGMPTFTVARPLDNPYLDQFLNRFRGATGQQILPKRDSAPQITRLLDRGGALLLLGDQFAGPKGCWVDFFGRPASVHKAISLFSIGNQAPMVVCFGRRRGRAMQFEIGAEAVIDPLDGGEETSGTRELTQWFTGQLETVIRRAPEQYWWLHRRWKDPRPYERRRRRQRAA